MLDVGKKCEVTLRDGSKLVCVYLTTTSKGSFVFEVEGRDVTVVTDRHGCVLFSSYTVLSNSFHKVVNVPTTITKYCIVRKEDGAVITNSYPSLTELSLAPNYDHILRNGSLIATLTYEI